MIRAEKQNNSINNSQAPGEVSIGTTSQALISSVLEDSETYLEGLRLEDKYISSPSSWMLAQTFKENRDAALSVRNRLVKELTVYKPFLRQHPFNKYFMMVDERTNRVNEIDKYLNFTRQVGNDNADRITESDIERARQVPIESLYSFAKVQRSSKTIKTCCPFHNDEKPSMVIYKDTNSFYCFSQCQVGGDAIAFLMKLEGLSFVEAVGRLK